MVGWLLRVALRCSYYGDTLLGGGVCACATDENTSNAATAQRSADHNQLVSEYVLLCLSTIGDAFRVLSSADKGQNDSGYHQV